MPSRLVKCLLEAVFFKHITCTADRAIDDPPAGTLEFPPGYAITFLGCGKIGIVPLLIAKVPWVEMVEVVTREIRFLMGLAREMIPVIHAHDDHLAESHEKGDL